MWQIVGFQFFRYWSIFAFPGTWQPKVLSNYGGRKKKERKVFSFENICKPWYCFGHTWETYKRVNRKTTTLITGLLQCHGFTFSNGVWLGGYLTTIPFFGSAHHISSQPLSVSAYDEWNMIWIGLVLHVFISIFYSYPFLVCQYFNFYKIPSRNNPM